MENKELQPLITNMDEYKELVEKFLSLCEKLQTFEFMFSEIDVSQPCF